MSQNDEIATASQRRRRLRLWAATALACLAMVTPMARWGARRFWFLDLLTHFPEPSALLSVVAALALVRAKKARFALPFVALAAWQLFAVARFYAPNPVQADPESPVRLRILMANLYYVNDRYDLLADLIRRERPDVVGLVEVSTKWVEGLEATGIRSEYPYRLELPFGGQGVALWLREPPYRIEPPQVYSIPGNPVIVAVLKLGDKLVSLWLVHPPNPIGSGKARANPDLVALMEQVGLREGSRIVVGDLNRTEGSPYFDDFLKVTRLRDSRIGFGRQGTWPTWSPYRIPIDHAFLTDDLAVVNRRIGPWIGSDHRPLLIEVAPALEPASPSAKTTN